MSESGYAYGALTPERWEAFTELFGPRGACGGCWCMTPRLTRSEYEKNKGEGNKQLLKAMVDRGDVPGVLIYRDGEVVAWCAIEPRERFSSLARSRILQPVDELRVHSLVCLFVRKDRRGQGVSRAAIHGAVHYAAARGASIVEAYPSIPRQERIPAAFAYNGIATTFAECGFKEVARRSETRPIMRRYLEGSAEDTI